MISVQRRRIQYIHCLLRHLRDRHGLNLTTQTSTGAPFVFKLALRPSWRISPWKFHASFRVPFYLLRFLSCRVVLGHFSLLLSIDVEPLSMFPPCLAWYFGLKSSHADDMSLSSLSSMCAVLRSDSYRFRLEKPVLCYKYKCPFIKDRKRQRHANPLSLLQANT